jgi:glycerol-3-phosphate dehydrogenase subunit C
MEWLYKRMRDGKLSKEFKTPLGKVGYHAACHLRAQKIGTPGRMLLSKIPGTEVVVVDECSAVDGTWGMKAQYYELGRKYCQKLVNGLEEGNFDALATDCQLSGQRIAGELSTDAFHPIELLNRAYGLPEIGPASVAPIQ